MCDTISRDSFDRFGDDLCEVILSFLSLTDCFRLQCVSKQFKHLIFNGQSKLILTDHSNHSNKRDKNSIIDELIVCNSEYYYTINYYLFDYVLKKCANITNIIISGIRLYVTDEIIILISDSCKNVKHFTIDTNFSKVSPKCWKKLAEKSLRNLETLSRERIYYADFGVINTLIKFAPQLKSLNSLNNIEPFFDQSFRGNKIAYFWNRMERVKIYIICDERFISFTDHFRLKLKSLEVIINDVTSFEIIKHLAYFERLEHLYCDFDGGNHTNFNELLKLIAIRCVRLKSLVIDSLKSPFFKVFSDGFKSLEKLTIKGRYKECESIELLKNCANLTHLVFDYTKVDESYFERIHVYLPQLKSIDIYSWDLKDYENTLKIMEHTRQMPNLRDLRIGFVISKKFFYKNRGSYMTTEDVLCFIDNCSTIRRIGIYPKKSTIDKMRIREYIREQNRKINIFTLNKF